MTDLILLRGEQIDEKEKLQMPNSDLSKKRRGPLLPLPPTITKDDILRYVKHLCQINTPLAQNPFFMFSNLSLPSRNKIKERLEKIMINH